MRRKRKSPKLNFSISIRNYYNLFRISLTNPNVYSKSIPQKTTPGAVWFFYSFNITISFLFYIIITKIFFHSSSLFFDLSSLLLIIPILILLFYLVSFLLHFLIKFFGGRGNYLDSLKALVFASFPLIFLRVPIFGILCIFLSIFLSINNIKHIHKVSYAIASFSVLMPFFLIIFSVTLFLSLSNKIQALLLLKL